MSVQKGRPSRFWGAIVGVALLLLGIILVIVILLSARLRQPVQVTVIRPAPAGTAPGPAAPASAASHTPPQAARPSAGPAHSQPRAAAADRHREPARAAGQPVKVVEKVVKVVEKQVKVVEKPVKVVEKPARVVEKPARRRPAPAASDERDPLLTRRPSDRAPLSTSGPSDRVPLPTSRPPSGSDPTGTFQETGLPSQLTYASQVWNASDLVQDLSADLLAADSRTVDGHTIYHDEDAAAPFPQIYVKVAGETDQYVRYVPTSS